jgi:hypothetical protein
MATHTFKLALNAAEFPVIYKQASRSVLRPQEDVSPHYQSRFSGTEDSADYNIIQLVYCENVLPIPKGIQSCGYVEEYPPYVPGPVDDFDQLMLVHSDIGENVSFSPGRGKNYVYAHADTGWVSYEPFVFPPDKKNITYGYVNGRTLIFYEGTKLVEWNPVGPTVTTLEMILPEGFDISDIKGNSAASNYHLIHTDLEVMWSTLTNVLDFADTDLGAGRQIPIDLRGRITGIRPISGGFLVYCSENVIAASFTNDASRPFAFREVQNSGGVNSTEQVTGEANAAGHYTYGTAGLQLVTLQHAETVYPEAADFLISPALDVWNPVAKRVDTLELDKQLLPKLQYLGNRYLFISYGHDGVKFTHALVFDTTLQRWGKLKIDHIDINLLPLEALGGPLRYYQLPRPYEFYDVRYVDLVYPADPPPGFRQNYGFLQKDGTVMMLVMDISALMGLGVALFGRCQLTRNRHITVHEMETEGMVEEPLPEFTLLGSFTGAIRDSQTTLQILQQDETFMKSGCRVTAKNFDLSLEGNFQLTTLILTATSHGAR